MRPYARIHLNMFRRLAYERQQMHLETKHRFFIPLDRELTIKMHEGDHEGSGRWAHIPPDEGSGVS